MYIFYIIYFPFRHSCWVDQQEWGVQVEAQVPGGCEKLACHKSGSDCFFIWRGTTVLSLTHSLSLSLSLSLDRKPALKVHSNSPREILRCKKYQNSHGWRRPTWRSLQCESLSPLSSVTAPETPAYPCGHQQRCFPPGGRGGGSYWAWWDDITVTTTEEEEKSF